MPVRMWCVLSCPHVQKTWEGRARDSLNEPFVCDRRVCLMPFGISKDTHTMYDSVNVRKTERALLTSTKQQKTRTKNNRNKNNNNNRWEGLQQIDTTLVKRRPCMLGMSLRKTISKPTNDSLEKIRRTFYKTHHTILKRCLKPPCRTTRSPVVYPPPSCSSDPTRPDLLPGFFFLSTATSQAVVVTSPATTCSRRA